MLVENYVCLLEVVSYGFYKRLASFTNSVKVSPREPHRLNSNEPDQHTKRCPFSVRNTNKGILPSGKMILQEK